MRANAVKQVHSLSLGVVSPKNKNDCACCLIMCTFPTNSAVEPRRQPAELTLEPGGATSEDSLGQVLSSSVYCIARDAQLQIMKQTAAIIMAVTWLVVILRVKLTL